MEFFSYYKRYKIDALGAFLASLFLLFFPVLAHGDTFSRTAGSSVTNPVNFSATIDDFTATFGSAPSIGAVWGFFVDTGNSALNTQIFNDQFSTNCAPVTQNAISENYTFPVGTTIYDIFAVVFDDGNCNENSWTYDTYLQRNSIDGLAFTVIAGTVVSTNMWGSDNGFWGSVDVSDVKGAMVASVQETGGSVWPMLKFVGIPLALIIALAVVNFIQQSVDYPKIAKFDTKKASELEEFFNKKGKTTAPYNYSSLSKKEQDQITHS